MADTTALQNIDQQFPIVDTRTGRPTDYLMRYLFDRQGYLTEADQELATILARQIIAGAGLTGGGTLGDGDVTLTADAQAILDLIGTTQGSILYRGADDWAALVPGTSGQFLKTNGVGADPAWATPSGGGGGLFYVPIASGGAVSTSAFATKGNVFVANADVEISAVSVPIDSAGTYHVQFVSLDGSNQIISSLGATASIVVAASGSYIFKLASRASVASGVKLGVCVIRTDGTTTTACSVYFPAVTGSAPGLDYAMSFTVARNANGATSDGLGTTNTDFTVSMSLFYTITSLA